MAQVATRAPARVHRWCERCGDFTPSAMSSSEETCAAPAHDCPACLGRGVLFTDNACQICGGSHDACLACGWIACPAGD